MENLEELIGSPMPRSTVVIERGPVERFAEGVTDRNPIYRDPAAAAAAGFDAIPAPPTFPIAMGFWGSFREDQPEDRGGMGPFGAIIEHALETGKMLLHGEQEFVYHRPIVVGDRLHSSGEVEQAYTKAGSAPMTFVVARTDWVDDDGKPVLTERLTSIIRG